MEAQRRARRAASTVRAATSGTAPGPGRTPPGGRAGARAWRWAKPLLWVAALVPLAWLGLDALRGGLGAEPIEEVTHRTGWWALTLLLATLAVTPLRRLSGRNELARLRRPLGLLAFLYATLHFLTYLVDQAFDWRFLAEDVVEHPYVAVGFTAFLLLVPLAATSTKAMIRRLGGRRWQRLHRLVYLAAALAVVHFYWLVKQDVREPLVFAAVLALLLALRLPWLRARARAR